MNRDPMQRCTRKDPNHPSIRPSMHPSIHPPIRAPQVTNVKPPMAVTNAVSWRSEGIRHKKNEVGEGVSC